MHLAVFALVPKVRLWECKGTRDRLIIVADLHQRLCGGEGAEVDAVAAAAGEFLVEDVDEVGGIGGDEVAREAAVPPRHDKACPSRRGQHGGELRARIFPSAAVERILA